MKFNVIVNGEKFTATMEDNSVVEDISKLCPFKTGFKRYKGHEYFTKLDKDIDVTGSELTKNVSKNDIVFYSGENSIVLFFEDVVIDPYQVIYLGKFDSDISEFLNSQDEIASVKFEVI